MLRLEPLKDDQAPSALLELVDGGKDMRLALTAQTVARERALGRETSEVTAANVRKVTQFREDGERLLEKMVRSVAVMERLGVKGRRGEAPERRKLEGPARGARYYPRDERLRESGGVGSATRYLGYNL